MGSIVSLMVSCQLESPVSVDEPGNAVKVESVTMTAHNFTSGDPATKTALNKQDSGLSFGWSIDDVVGVFPNLDNATQVRFPVKDGDIQEGSATQETNFTGNGWAVMAANKYMAYYPFTPDMDLDKTCIPVDYTGQCQDGNSSTAHISAYDNMAAAPTAPTSNGNIGLGFKHLGAVLELNLTLPKIAEYTTLTLSCEDMPFITAGTVDLTADEPCITGTAWDNDFVVSLKNFTTTEANQSVTIYVIIPPIDFSGHTINVRVHGPHADFNTHFTRGENKPFRPEKIYAPVIGDMEGGEVIKLESGDDFCMDIKTLANGESYILEKKDYLIRKVVFEATNDVANITEPALPHEDVSASDSQYPIYASWDSSTGTVTVTSPGYKVYGNDLAQHLFYNLVNLEGVDLADFSTQYTTDVRAMFQGCSKMSSIDISSFDLTNIYVTADMFAECPSLAAITWPLSSKFSSEQDIAMGGMFDGDSNLENIDLSCFDGCKIADSPRAFAGCSALKSIDVSEMDFSENYGGYTGMFENCSTLATLDVSGFNWSGIDGECTGVFYRCTGLKSVNLGDFYITNGGRLDSFFSNCTSLTDITYSRFVCQAEKYENFFEGCESLKNIDVSGWVTSRAISLTGMFNGCKALESIDVSTWSTSGVTSMNALFKGCESLTAINLNYDGFKTYEVTDMGNMFANTTRLQSLSYGVHFNTENVQSMDSMFSGCGLSTIDVSSFSTPKVGTVV